MLRHKRRNMIGGRLAQHSATSRRRITILDLTADSSRAETGLRDEVQRRRQRERRRPELYGWREKVKKT
jgi:hypothetical protein